VFRGQKVGNYIESLNLLECPILMQKQWPEIPHSVAYPINEIIAKYGGYFTNTISYMIAYAIYLGAKEIGIWGVDMAVDSEYHHQRPSCEYFIGLAKGMGINVVIPAESDLCKVLFLYGFQEKEKIEWKKKLDLLAGNLEGQINNAQNQLTIHQKKMEQAIGARQAMAEVYKIWK
jgi:hypothetical protein